ncbi:DUF389 domain-containing protein [Streptomyces sp. KLOTTS4A1]|uniref:DUF389 domain-containing protein n=1 Tax=Streptomyces sp. KLOTTS4A1 TaxID=3390996 RepID=UPI0039F584BB
MEIKVICERSQSAIVTGILDAEPGVAHVTVAQGISKSPEGGDVIEAVVAREVAEDILHQLAAHGVPRRGEVSLQPMHTMLSESAAAAERSAPGDSSDAVIWDEVVATTGEESRLTFVFLAFLTIACLLATVGVVTDSAVTIVGAMVVSPDFGPLAALAVAFAGRRRGLAVSAGAALGVGFPLAMLVTAALTGFARLIGLFEPNDLNGLQEVAFIYQVGPFSVIVALLAGTAGMIALTSEKSGPLVGVFISVTTVPAAGFAVLAAIAGEWHLCGEALLQLLVNVVGVTVAGTLTLLARRRHIIPSPGTGVHQLRRAPRRRL